MGDFTDASQIRKKHQTKSLFVSYLLYEDMYIAKTYIRSSINKTHKKRMQAAVYVRCCYPYENDQWLINQHVLCSTQRRRHCPTIADVEIVSRRLRSHELDSNRAVDMERVVRRYESLGQRHTIFHFKRYSAVDFDQLTIEEVGLLLHNMNLSLNVAEFQSIRHEKKIIYTIMDSEHGNSMWAKKRNQKK